MDEITIVIKPDPICPRCKRTDCVKAYRVFNEPEDGWWSKCLNCWIWFNCENDKIEEIPEHQRNRW